MKKINLIARMVIMCMAMSIISYPAYANTVNDKQIKIETKVKTSRNNVYRKIKIIKEKNANSTSRVNTYKNKHTKKLRRKTLKKISNSEKYYNSSIKYFKKAMELAKKKDRKAYEYVKIAKSKYKKSNIASNKAVRLSKEAKHKFLKTQTRSLYWDGGVLTRSKGVNYGISGKETYYNLNMQWCVYYMRQRGFSEKKYPVWVRDDGCKMFGDYIMCAANLSEHPYGSLVESSLGTCIVVDTGGFASSNRYQLDIAVTW